MKKLLLLMLLLMIPIVFSAEEECQRVQLTKDIPCTIISTFKPSTGCDQNVSIYTENGSLVQVSSWNDSTPFCKFSWNISSPIGTYVYNSSIEEGVITLERADNMLSIILSFMFIIAFYIAIGVPHKPGFVKFLTWGLALLELLMMVWIIWIVESGGSILGLLELNAIATLLIGGFLGVFSLFVIMRKMMKADDKMGNDDAYTKWVNK